MGEPPHPDPFRGDSIEIAGPWQHRHVAANGARFHVAHAGPVAGRLILLLHGFPEFWWTWRDLIPVLAEHGWWVAAMDLRGYGGSDRTPRGYDPMTLAQDVSGVVKALGARDAVLVGHGWGGYVAWAAAARHPEQVSALCTVSAPHPLALVKAARTDPVTPAAGHLLAMQLPMLPERRLARGTTGYLGRHLEAWSAPASGFPSPEEVATYQAAMARWPSSHCALEYHRWLLRSRLRADGRRFTASMRRPVEQPVCCVRGEQERILPRRAHEQTRAHVANGLRLLSVPGTGHFPHEEDPVGFSRLLLDWLDTLDTAPRGHSLPRHAEEPGRQ